MAGVGAVGVEACGIAAVLQVAIQVLLADHKAEELLEFEGYLPCHWQTSSFHLCQYRRHLPHRHVRQV